MNPSASSLMPSIPLPAEKFKSNISELLAWISPVVKELAETYDNIEAKIESIKNI